MMMLSGIGTNAIGFDLGPGVSFLPLPSSLIGVGLVNLVTQSFLQ